MKWQEMYRKNADLWYKHEYKIIGAQAAKTCSLRSFLQEVQKGFLENRY